MRVVSLVKILQEVYLSHITSIESRMLHLESDGCLLLPSF